MWPSCKCGEQSTYAIDTGVYDAFLGRNSREHFCTDCFKEQEAIKRGEAMKRSVEKLQAS